ncbi:MAG: phosphatidylserine/phosphatidylglycerophosphate/cardiolipin synthase family protein [Sandaracinaceae bacterium]
MRRAIGLLVLAVVGCGSPSDVDGGMGPMDGSSADGGQHLPPGPPPTALLEVVALDVWGRPLDESSAQLDVRLNGASATAYGWPAALVLLDDSARIDLALEAPELEALTATLDYTGDARLDAVTLDGATSGHGASLRHELRTIDGVELPVHTIYLGLRHRWFAAEGRPARTGNHLELYISGEEAWSHVSTELGRATESAHLATWWWQSEFELVREEGLHPYQSVAERQPNTILAHMDRVPGTVRVLVGQLWTQDGLLSSLTSDGPLEDRGMTPGDGFEYMGMANPSRGVFDFTVAPFTFRDRVDPNGALSGFDPEDEIASRVPSHTADLTQWPISLDVPHASYHQKFIVIDGRVAFIGGMNLRPVDWDTEDHLVYEPRRMAFDATATDRLDVVNRMALPDNGPRKDYMVRLEGPSVEDAEDIFHERWANQLSEGVTYAEYASDYTPRTGQPAFEDGIAVQVTATLPEPFWEHAIAETWFNAIENAERYILIEDQYWRVPMLTELLIERMTMNPELRLIVITKPVNEYTDPGCEWTHRMNEDLASRFGGRYATYQLRAFDIDRDTLGPDETMAQFEDMDVHSKLLIVDDVFLSVGSCNKNNRGIVYEGELNVAVLDAAWVRAARRRIIQNMLPPGTPVSDDPLEWADQIRAAAAANDAVYGAWEAEGFDIDIDGAPLPAQYTPAGLLYGLSFRTPADCLLEGVGPDMT